MFSLNHRQSNIFLGLEVKIQRSFGDTGGLRDVRKGGTAEPQAIEDFCSTDDNSLTSESRSILFDVLPPSNSDQAMLPRWFFGHYRE